MPLVGTAPIRLLIPFDVQNFPGIRDGGEKLTQMVVAIAPEPAMLPVSKIARHFQGLGISGELGSVMILNPMSGNSLGKRG